ncbi:rho-associated protein kinase 1-like isoform X2 [Cimex lectularius]|nr:rho-associated protein kinase 1-like isoform X2 [Cimex lectularius]
MEMIDVACETQRTHFEEIKEYVGKCLDEIQNLTKERDEAMRLYEVEKSAREKLQAERDEAKIRLAQSTETYLREFSEAKNHWEGVEEHLRTTTENIQKELREFEDHNKLLNDKLIYMENELATMSGQAENLKEERDSLVKKDETLEREFEKLKCDFQSVADELHETKMKLLQEENSKHSLILEGKKYKKAAEVAVQKMTAMEEEKVLMAKNHEDLTQTILKTKTIESEMKDVKFYLNILGKGNGTINEKLNTVLSLIKKEGQEVGVQTDLTTKQLSEYDHLDREATILVMKMREELLTTKDELLGIKQENETLRNFVRDVKRDREMREEEERVEKLEEAVKALGELVSREQNRPSKEDTIIKKLSEVKRDLDMIKTNNKTKPGHDVENMELTSIPIKLTSFRNSRR